MMQHQTIVVRMGEDDAAELRSPVTGTQCTTLQLMKQGFLEHGIGRYLEELGNFGLRPSETAIDLIVLAAAVTAADTKIEREAHGQDGWTRQIDLCLPVLELGKWSNSVPLLERMLKFLTGDLWRLRFRERPWKGTVARSETVEWYDEAQRRFECVCLFSGGLDSFVGAVDLLEDPQRTLFVSHYKDASTSRQEKCMSILREAHSDREIAHIRTNIGFSKNDLPGLGTETSTRGRSFLFLTLAAVAADAIGGQVPTFVPENGFISLNVPLTNLRIGSLSTRTTHPYYMACWKAIMSGLGIGGNLGNPYQFKTKGEMLRGCLNEKLLRSAIVHTISCSSYNKSRFEEEEYLRKHIHCGYCVPCLIRRAAIEAAFGEDPTRYNFLQNWNTEWLNARKAKGKDVRGFRMLYQRLQQNPGLAEMLVHQPGPLPRGAARLQYVGVLRRGIEEIGRLVNQAKYLKP